MLVTPPPPTCLGEGADVNLRGISNMLPRDHGLSHALFNIFTGVSEPDLSFLAVAITE